MKKMRNKGISVIEILIAVTIIIVISAIIIPNFSDFKDQQILKNTTEDIATLLNEAKNNTISSKNSTTYGVHLQSDKAILYSGLSYVDSVLNKQIDFGSSVIIPTVGGVNLTGGGNDILFDRITGDTTKDGTIKIQLINDSTKQKIITINKLGVVSIN